MFSNDTSLAIIAQISEELEIEVFLKTALLLDWLNTNKLNSNRNKTKLMQFPIRNQNYTLSIMLEENDPDSIEEVTFLGVVLDTNLYF